MRVPKYQMIKNDLKQQLTSGKFENGDKFYTEAELMNIYQVSSITVIRALNDLVTEGYLTRRQGKGTFVSRARKGKNVRFSDIEMFPLNTDQVTVLSIERGNNADILEHLKLEKTEYYYCIERIRRAAGVPYIYQKSFLPEQFINANYPDLSYYNSIYQRLRQDFNIHMSDENFSETNEIKLPTPQAVADLLQLKTSEPSVLQIRKTYNETSGQIFEYIESYKRWDYYKIKLGSDE